MVEIRKIQPADNEAIGAIIKQVMTEFGADPKTTVLGDPSINSMYENYQVRNTVYYIAELNGRIVGGCGIKKLDGSEEGICELQRMFLLPEARGKKIGKRMLELCISKAEEFGYKKIYLESLTQMEAARMLYSKNGFKQIDSPMGKTGHGGCNVWMVLDLSHLSHY